MRLKRLTLWTLVTLLVLAAGILAAGILLLFFFPWEKYEGSIQEYLNEELPVRVEFSKPSILWARGLGISLDQVSVKGKGDSVPESLNVSARKVTLRPSLLSLLKRELKASLRLDAPAVHLKTRTETSERSEAVEEKTPGKEGMDSEQEGSSKPETLAGLVPIPGGFSLVEVRVFINDGSLITDRPGKENEPPLKAVSRLEASVKVGPDLSFACKISESRVEWEQEGAPPWALAGRVEGEALGRILLEKIYGKADVPANPEPGIENDKTALAKEKPAVPSTPPILPGNIQLPEWLSLTEAVVSVREGSFLLTPRKRGEGAGLQGVSQLEASVRLKADRSLSFDLSDSQVHWSQDDDHPLALSGRFACRLNGRTLDPDTIQAKGNVKVDNLAVKTEKTELQVTETLALSFDFERATSTGLTASALHLTGPGADIRTRGSAKWSEGLEEIHLQDLEAEVQEWDVLRTLLPPDTEMAGKLSVIAQSLILSPSEGMLPSTQRKSFRLVLPRGLQTEGAQVHISDGRIRLTVPDGISADVKGLEASLLQKQGQDWNGKVEMAMLELIHRPDSSPEGQPQTAGANSSRPDAEAQPAESGEIAEGGNVPAEGKPSPSETDSASKKAEQEKDGSSTSQGQALEEKADPVPPGGNGTPGGTPEVPAQEQPVQKNGSEVQSITEEAEAPKEEERGGEGEDPEKVPLRFAGPISAQWKWTETQEDVATVLVVDLTKGLCQYKNLLDKPAEVPLQVGFRARINSNEVKVGKAYLLLGEMELGAAGTMNDPEAPFLEARLVSNILSLNALSELSPFAREHGMKGLVEIKNLEMKGRLQSLKETAVLKVRLSGKDLDYNQTVIKGFYAQALYEHQNLTLNPLIIHPGQGVMEATFSADFSPERLAGGRHQYYGTLKVNNVELDKLTMLVSPEYAGKAFGKLNVNLACRGTGFSLEDVKQRLEAKANVSLSNVTLEGENGPGKGKGESFAQKTDKMVQNLAGGSTTGVETATLNPEERRLLSNNNVSGLISLRNGTVSTRNLLATYEGKFIELAGDLELSGGLNYMGKIFFGNRNVPFRGNCRIGKDSCIPIPDLKAMSVSAAKEVFKGLGTLSSGAKNVFQDIFF